MAAVAAVLLALILFNAADICSAVELLPGPAHPCCPVSDRQSPDHCGKLGCFMAAPALKANVQGGIHPGWIAIPLVALLVEPCVAPTAIANASPLSIDRCVAFSRLLI